MAMRCAAPARFFFSANKPYRFLFCISRRRHRLALHDFIFFLGTTLSLLTRAALLAMAKNTSDYKLVYKMLVKPETEGIQSKSKLKKQGNLISKIRYFFLRLMARGTFAWGPQDCSLSLIFP